MLKKYFIDGNNVIGKLPELKNLQKKDPESSRERLVHILDRHFAKQKIKLTIFLDGFPKYGIKSAKGKIIYSHERRADDDIKDEISRSKKRTLITVVSSDHEIQNFARACSASVITAEQFVRDIKNKKTSSSEEEIIKSISDEEMKKLFGA